VCLETRSEEEMVRRFIGHKNGNFDHTATAGSFQHAGLFFAANKLDTLKLNTCGTIQTEDTVELFGSFQDNFGEK
jgi:hypothetical protein